MNTKDPRAKLPDAPLADNERLKGQSNLLRGTIKEDLADELTGGFNGDNFQLIRFHGMYEQDDRDIRAGACGAKARAFEKRDVALPFAWRHHPATTVVGHR
jgi:sulfite reductase beta subunit-like hemoprotein